MDSLLASFNNLSVEKTPVLDVKPTDSDIVETFQKFHLFTTYLKSEAKAQLEEMQPKFEQCWQEVRKGIKYEAVLENQKDMKLFCAYTELVLSKFPDYRSTVKSIIQNNRSFYCKNSKDYHPICYTWFVDPKSLNYTGAWRDRSVRYNSGCNEATDYILKIQFIMNLCKAFGMKFNATSVDELRKYWDGVTFTF